MRPAVRAMRDPLRNISNLQKLTIKTRIVTTDRGGKRANQTEQGTYLNCSSFRHAVDADVSDLWSDDML